MLYLNLLFFFDLLYKFIFKQFFEFVLSIVKVDHVLILILKLILILLLHLYIVLHLIFQHRLHLIYRLFFLRIFDFFFCQFFLEDPDLLLTLLLDLLKSLLHKYLLLFEGIYFILQTLFHSVLGSFASLLPVWRSCAFAFVTQRAVVIIVERNAIAPKDLGIGKTHVWLAFVSTTGVPWEGHVVAQGSLEVLYSWFILFYYFLNTNLQFFDEKVHCAFYVVFIWLGVVEAWVS